MEREFSPEELSQLVKAAQVAAPGFTQEEYQSMVDSQKKLGESGFCEAVWAVLRLQKQKGINCAEVLDAVDELLQKRAKLETDIASLEKKQELLEEKNRQAEDTLRQLNETIKQAKDELGKIKSEHQKETQTLDSFKEKAKLEKERIDKDLEKCRKKVGVTEEQVKVAGNLKAELDKHGFSLELVLGLSQEFAGYEDARDKLAEGLKKYKTFSAFLASINQEGEEKKKTLQAEISSLEGSRRQAEYILSQLRAEQRREESLLSQLQNQIAEKDDVMSFYHRHQHLQPLIEYLDNQGGITFHHCIICGSLFWIVRPGTSNMSGYKCAWCGNVLIEPDKTAYSITGQQPGVPVKLIT
jgi:predicted  nucleic acid-binding Zn-ribbon protein